MTWDPIQYLRFDTPRLRPALDLLARVDVADPRHLVDLGCGAGNVTAFLADRWPDADLVGVDKSPEMLARARRDHPAIEFVEDDIAGWDPRRKIDVIYSNAVLHWLDDHRLLFPRLARDLAPGGVLAVQMPNNQEAPAQMLLREIAGGEPWGERLTPLLRLPVHDPAFYYEALRPHLSGPLDIWTSEYLMVLTGDNPVAEFTRGSLLRPLLAALDEDEAQEFWERYVDAVGAAYPIRADGSTLYPFRRLFIVGRR